MAIYGNMLFDGLFTSFIAQHYEEYKCHLASLNKTLKADFLVLAAVQTHTNKAQTCIVLNNGIVSENFNYELQITQSDNCHREDCNVFQKVNEKFRQNKLIQTIQAKTGLEIPVICEGKTIGQIFALSLSNTSSFRRKKFLVQLLAEQISARLTCELQLKKQSAYQKLFDEVCGMSDIGAWEYDVRSKTFYWSDEIFRIFGVPQDSAITPEIPVSFYTPSDKRRMSAMFRGALRYGTDYIADFHIIDAFGRHKWLRTNGKVEKDPHNMPLRVYGAIKDVTDEHLRIHQEREQRGYLQGVLNSLNDAVITVDFNGIIVASNERAENLFGYPECELAGLNVNTLMPEPYSLIHENYLRSYQKTGDAKIIGFGRQLPAKRKDGSIFQIELTLSEYKYGDDIYYIGIVRDITQRIENERKIYRLAFIDEVTGLRNKVSFEHELKVILTSSARADNYFYASLIDLDCLARFNLTYGTEFTNQIIAQTSMIISRVAGDKFRLFKFGPDEFILLSTLSFTSSSLEDLNYEDLEHELLNPSLFEFRLKDEQINVSLSMASIIARADLTTKDSLIDSLEYAMKLAKRHKPFGHVFLGPLAMDEYERSKRIKKCIPGALLNDEFHVVLQPQYRFNSSFFTSEALLRWTSCELGVVSPSEFIPLAEESDDIIKIGDWVLEAVCKIISDVHKQGLCTRISVNISGRQIIQPDFESKLFAIIDKYAVPAHMLMLELTETTLVSDIGQVKRKMHALASLGFAFSIDDFGTGYSSLSYIKELPIKELKIDKYFVDSINENNDLAATSIVNVIIDLAKSMELEVVAEGVETQQQYDYLKQRGCNSVQGYYISRPLSVHDWLLLLKH